MFSCLCQASRVLARHAAGDVFVHLRNTRTGVNDKDYHVPFAFNGTINSLTVKIGPSQLSADDQKTATAATAEAGD